MKLYIALLVTVIAMVIIPINVESSPEWKVRVLDSNRNPASGVYVKRSWHHFSAESEYHSDDTYTNKDGYAYFSKKHAKTTIANIITRATKNILTLKIHASIGASTNIIAINGDYQGSTSNSFGQLEKEIILYKRLGPPVSPE